VLDPGIRSTRPRAPSGGGVRKRTATAAHAPAVKGPYGVAGPYESDGGRYEVRLERVPGGLRLAVWAAGSLQRRAPELDAADLGSLVASAAEDGALAEDDGLRVAAAEVPGTVGRSPGRAGELRDELRVEPLDDGRLRIARWVMRPGRGWELQDAPVMLPAERFAQALRSAAAPAT
jgi:hypothetical protein